MDLPTLCENVWQESTGRIAILFGSSTFGNLSLADKLMGIRAVSIDIAHFFSFFLISFGTRAAARPRTGAREKIGMVFAL